MGTLKIRQGAKLPHWEKDGATYAVTYRLNDSLPQHVLLRIERERGEIRRNFAARELPPTAVELERLAWLESEVVQEKLDAGYGECLLRDDRAAKIMTDEWRAGDGVSYDLAAWVVMPNHVHVVFRPCSGVALPKVMQGWKGRAARRINLLFGRTGPLWGSESYDHIIRNRGEFEHAAGYVMQNPVKAGFAQWPWVWRSGKFAYDSSTGLGWQ